MCDVEHVASLEPYLLRLFFYCFNIPKEEDLHLSRSMLNADVKQWQVEEEG